MATEPYWLEVVTWRDAYFDFERSGAEDNRDDYLVETVGWVEVTPTEDLRSRGQLFLDVVSERLPDEDGDRAVTHVPVAGIVHRVPLVPRKEWEKGND